MSPSQFKTDSSTTRKRRSKRHIESKVDLLRRDDRVEYVIPQRYLRREKRELKHAPLPIDELIRSLDRELRLEKTDDNNDNALELAYLENLKRIVDNEQINQIDKRKKLLEEFNKFDAQTPANDIEKLNLPEEIQFNDRNFRQQWYLINDGQLKIPPMHDINVRDAWINGYSGKKVVIVVVDDGIDHEHPDFSNKFRKDLSYDYNDLNDTEHDPMPATFDNQNNHGTRCAGAAVANANNSVCGVGVAYDAEIAGIRVLDGPITDLLEARALSYKAKHVDIRSASWGPKDDGTHMEYPGKFVNLALEDGVKNGRNGKGTLFVWASGNGGANDDDCSCDGYVSHWNIISIGSINHHGVTPYFMELCPSTMAVVYSGGLSKIAGSEDDPRVRVVASDVRGKCTTTFQGTSSAAPIAAGAFALVLEANPELGYRDVMHLIAKTSRIPNIEDKAGWIINGAHYHVNEKYGFGVLDVSQMIQEAQGWKNVPERQNCTVNYDDELPKLGGDGKIELEVDVENCSNIDFLEHVVANISFTYTSRGDIKITLVSPAGTPSEILSFRKNDVSSKGVVHFPFMTLYNWGESPQGKWKLIIETRTKPGKTNNEGSLDYFSLNFFGFKNTDNSKLKKRFTQLSRSFVPSSKVIEKIYHSELKLSRQTRIIHKRLIESDPSIRDLLKDID